MVRLSYSSVTVTAFQWWVKNDFYMYNLTKTRWELSWWKVLCVRHHYLLIVFHQVILFHIMPLYWKSLDKNKSCAMSSIEKTDSFKRQCSMEIADIPSSWGCHCWSVQPVVSVCFRRKKWCSHCEVICRIGTELDFKEWLVHQLLK